MELGRGVSGAITMQRKWVFRASAAVLPQDEGPRRAKSRARPYPGPRPDLFTIHRRRGTETQQTAATFTLLQRAALLEALISLK